jgi:5-methyltetrahydrofolate--homocysteine methyltransferase
MKITEFLKTHLLYLDGGMGTLLQARGLSAGELPERWNLSHPEVIREIHKAYFDAGSHVVCTNTFGANALKFDRDELEQIVAAAIRNAKDARDAAKDSANKWIALDIGPSGRMLAPYGDLDFEDAVSLFGEVARLGETYGADLIMIETMSDSYETKAALLGAKENSSLPVFVSNAYGEDGKLMTGADPLAMIALLEGMGADAIGINCSLGPKSLGTIAKAYLDYSSLPVLFKPNAGLPSVRDGKTVYDLTPAEFAHQTAELVRLGISAVGGCCGTTPEYISALVEATAKMSAPSLIDKNLTLVSSYTHAVCFGDTPVLIGERINPTGKKRFQTALRQKDMEYILGEGIRQEERGAEVLDVNVGLPDINECELLTNAVCSLQAILDTPLQIDSANPDAMEAALRRYNGKAMINSVSGKRESMEKIFPLAKKYGGLVVALTLDENGIPKTAEERLEIARRILEVASSYGIAKKNLIFDPLALTVSADDLAATQTLRAVELIGKELGCHTSLGVSNVSFGLPAREAVTASFLTMALDRGLSAAILNPYSVEIQKAYHTYLVLSGKDRGCARYIEFASTMQEPATLATPKTPTNAEGGEGLSRAIEKGRREQAATLTRRLLETVPPLQIVQSEIVPALDRVGAAFEAQTLYLPQLLMSAEAAGAAFEEIKSALPKDEKADKCAVVLATVKGDIHDIGKNIVRLLLENYGFAVRDLGRDVSPEEIADAVCALHAPLVGLSALMTTTVPAMEETVRLLRERAPYCRVMVGGAVLNQEYADAIGAHFYAKDAMEGVRYAETVNREQN